MMFEKQIRLAVKEALTPMMAQLEEQIRENQRAHADIINEKIAEFERNMRGAARDIVVEELVKRIEQDGEKVK